MFACHAHLEAQNEQAHIFFQSLLGISAFTAGILYKEKENNPHNYNII